MCRWPIGAALALAALLAACGGDGDDAGSGASGAGAGGSTSSSGTGGAITPPTCEQADAPAGYFAALGGSAEGDGSLESPWDIATALSDPPGVAAGDTIYLRGGVYTGTFVIKLDGTAEAPITVRSYPGEWAVLDSAGSDEPVVQLYRSHTVVRDLEVTNTAGDRYVARATGIYVEGEGHALVNLVVHDVGSGITASSATDTLPELSPELMIYGCILYDNGWQDTDRGHGHHLYLTNRDGTKHVHETVLFNAFGFGFHLYSDNDGHYAEGYDLHGNVGFQNGAGTPGISKLYDNFMIGHNGSYPVRRLQLSENYGWAQGPAERSVRLGWDTPNEDVVLSDNYFVGQTIFQPSWTSVTMSGNTFYGDVEGVDPAAHPDNTYLSSAPTGNLVVVRPNSWQAGRAHVLVYNWEGLDAVEVDLGAVLAAGESYELRHVMDLAAAPVASGTWDTTPIAVPMIDLPVTQPIGLSDGVDPSETPGKDFAVFLLVGCDG